jgi:hypothetical protein
MWYAVGLLLSMVPGAGMLYVLTYSFMWVLVPATALQLSYGTAATCFPMIPTCVVQDVVVSLQTVLPVRMAWPDALQTSPGCIELAQGRGRSSAEAASLCLKSCRAQPFNFRQWEDSAAWLICLFDPANCTSFDVPYAPTVARAAWNYSRVNLEAVHSAQALDMWHAHQFCFVVTLAQALPWFFVVVAGIYVVFSMLSLPFAVI